MDKIDFVLTWVDGSDPKWREERSKFDTTKATGNKEVHYRDWGTLRYWFRSVEKYAPWVNKIHFVTCGQTPQWLNTHHPKLHLVNHTDYIPKEYLPTFSANPIELNLHRIQELSEHFVYFNDDTFISASMSESDFFRNGLPCDSATFSALIPSVKGEVITHILFNDLLLINTNFNKKILLVKNLGKWLSLKYGKDVIKNLYYLPIRKFTGFVNPHLPNAFLKSTYEEVWNTEEAYLSKVCKNKFRNIEDVNQYLMRYWQLAKGNFIPRSPKIGKCYTIGEDNQKIEEQLRLGQIKLICINDNSKMDDIEKQEKWLCNLLDTLLPEKSEFERIL